MTNRSTGRELNGDFAVGNRFWELTPRPSGHAIPMFTDPEVLWDRCVAYFEWATNNPLIEAEIHGSKDGPLLVEKPKMQAMTIKGMCLFIGISSRAWEQWRLNRPDLEEVIDRAEAVIWQQKFAGAAAGLLNPTIISRELGLAERSELTGKNGGPLQTEDVTADADAFTRQLARLAAGSGAGTAHGKPDAGSEGGA